MHDSAMPPRPGAAPGHQAASREDHPGAPFLRTRRMQLRGLRHADLFHLQQLGRDPRATRALLDARVDSLAAAAALVDHANAVYLARPGLGIWRADDRQGRFLGFFSLMAEFARDEVEIGTRLLPSAWGRGYALEGGAALCTHAFDRLGLTSLVGLCDPTNRSVPPLLGRLGFVADGNTEQFGNPALRFVLPRGQWSGVRPRMRGRGTDVAPAAAG